MCWVIKAMDPPRASQPAQPLSMPNPTPFLAPLASLSSLLSLDSHTLQYLPFPDTPQALPLLLSKAQAPAGQDYLCCHIAMAPQVSTGGMIPHLVLCGTGEQGY